MNKMLIPILFAIGTAIFWGCYGPTIGNAQPPKVDGKPLAPPVGWSPFKPYVFIGVAYLVVAVAGGLLMMKIKGDSFAFSGPAGETGLTHFAPAKWGFLAGLLGAAGAFCLTSAMMISRGNALLVMPIVFGGAVSVTAIVSVWIQHARTTPMLWVGMALTVVGVVTVAINTPHGHPPKKPAATDASATTPSETSDSDASSEEN